MAHQRIGLVLALCAGLVSVAAAHASTSSDELELVAQPKPEFPKHELTRGREGWVVLSFTVSEDGSVTNPSIDESSGSDAFNQAALDAVSKWRYEPGVEKTDSVQLNFVYERKLANVSRKFFARIEKIHKEIDNGNLDDAQVKLDKMRGDDDLNAFELAYTYIAEGRIAAERGDTAGHLECFRKAILNEGRWLSRNDYLKLLNAVVVLEIQQEDYSSALRDYALLTETGPGRDMAGNLEEPIRTIEAFVENRGEVLPPYMAANKEVLIRHEGRRAGGPRAEQRPSSADEPPPRPAAEPTTPNR